MRTLRSWTTTERKKMPAGKLAPVHPGEVLLEEFLNPMNLSQNRLALALGVPPRRINEIVLGKTGHHRRYRPATGTLLRHVAGAEPT